MNLFPGNYGLSMDGMFLYFLRKTIPPKPWPKSVAGLPPVFAPEMGRQPRLFGHIVRNGSIGDGLNSRDMVDWEPLFVIIRTHFQEIGISIIEVMYWRDYLVIILQHRSIDMAKLPSRAANITVTYCYEDEMGRPSTPQARCETDPIPGNQAGLTRLVPVKGRRTGDFVFLDLLDTGFPEGSFKITSFQRIEQQWVYTIWLYMGQDSADSLLPVYGSAIWTAGGDVLGFCRYAPKDGPMKNWCAGVAADELIDRGFTIVDTANR